MKIFEIIKKVFVRLRLERDIKNERLNIELLESMAELESLQKKVKELKRNNALGI